MNRSNSGPGGRLSDDEEENGNRYLFVGSGGNGGGRRSSGSNFFSSSNGFSINPSVSSVYSEEDDESIDDDMSPLFGGERSIVSPSRGRPLGNLTTAEQQNDLALSLSLSHPHHLGRGGPTSRRRSYNMMSVPSRRKSLAVWATTLSVIMALFAVVISRVNELPSPRTETHHLKHFSEVRCVGVI